MSSLDAGSTLLDLLEPLEPFFEAQGITEISINRPGEVYTLSDSWTRHDVDITLPWLSRFSTAVAAFNHSRSSEGHAILSGTLPNRERVQVVRPPACEDRTFAISIRRPGSAIITMNEYDAQGFFNIEQMQKRAERHDDELQTLYDAGQWRQFFAKAVETGKVIVVAGSTHSGKTTFTRTLISLIPEYKRIITIEDSDELAIAQPNRVQLYYESSPSKDESQVTATDLIKATMRLRPDVVILGEVRGGEAYDFINLVQSGHGGSIVTVHASSCEAAYDRLATLVGESANGYRLPDERVRERLHSIIDIVVHLTPDKRISWVNYKGG